MMDLSNYMKLGDHQQVIGTGSEIAKDKLMINAMEDQAAKDAAHMRDLLSVTGSDESDEDEEDEEPLIVQLMESMFNRKKTVFESQQMLSRINIKAIQQEKREAELKEVTRLANIERSRKFLARLKKCERLNELIQADNEEIPNDMIDRPDLAARANPFFLALEAQKKEREKYKQLLQLAI